MPTDVNTARPRIAIILDLHGDIQNVYCDGCKSPLDVCIATERKDHVITGRPITMLATVYPERVQQVFRRAVEKESGHKQ